MKNYYLVLILAFIALTNRVSGQDFFCTTTNSPGSITIQWTDGSPLTTNHYELLWSAVAGNFNSTDSLVLPATGLADNSYTLTSVNGNTSVWYFKLNIVSGSFPTRTGYFSNMFLDVTYAIPGNSGIAKLSWNPVSAGSNGNFTIQRFEFPSWKTLSFRSVTSPVAAQVYLDTLSFPFCDTSQVSYRIAFQETGSNYQSVSNSTTRTFIDNSTPANPTNDSVSIYNNPVYPALTGCPVIGWTATSGSDIDGYIIYRYSGSAFVTMDTIPADSTLFIDKTVSGCLQSYTYALAAIDKCGRTSPGTFLSSPGSIYLVTSEINPCTKRVNLNWNHYNNISGGLAGYKVFRQVGNQPYQLIHTLPAGTISFVDSMNFINGEYYTYVVQAFNTIGTITSTSCHKRIIYQGPSSPDTLYIEQASVVNDDHIEINCYYSPYASVNQLVLERTERGFTGFLPIDTLTAPPGGYLQQKLIFSDYSADFRTRSYTYRLTYVDTCKVYAIPPYANTATSIYLTCNLQNAYTSQLNWNAYETWLSGVNTYEIYRYINGVNDPPGVLANVPSGIVTYSESISSMQQSDAVCYKVVARESPGNPVVSNALSASNSACVARDPMVFIPNAFAPYGLNNRFRPIVNFIIADSFLMVIFNKWGQQIFETRDYFSGWDGTVKGAMSPADVYTYCITYKDLKGKEITKRGLFTLVR